MTDIATGFLQAIEAFLNTRLGDMTEGAWNDTGPFLEAVVTFDGPATEASFNELKANITAMEPIFKEIGEKIKKQTDLIKKMVTESATDIDKDDFDIDVAARVAIRIGMALAAADEAYNIIATELAKDATGTVNEATRNGLLGLWNPWAQPFKDLGAGAGNLLNKFGELIGVTDLVGELGNVIEFDREGGGFKLLAKIAKSGPVTLGALTLDQVSFEAFLQFSDREVANPTDAEKTSLVERDGKFYRGDVAIVGLRLRTILQPGLTSDPLLAKIMPGSAEPKSTTLTAISLDSAQGFYLGDGRGNEKAILPVRFAFPGFELREMAVGLVRNPAREVTAFEITTSIAATLGDAVGLQVVGSGFVVTPEGVAQHQAVFNLPVSPRWPDAIGLRVAAGPITGGGFIQRVERTYKVDGADVKRIEFGGVIQLQILNFGVSAIVILSPDPFSLVLVIGVRFPTAIDLGMGFTLNGIGGILAIDRGLSLEALRAGMKDHILEKMLFPDNPVAEAPKLLDKVANIFPPRTGGFVVGPIVELGWGSQAKFVEMKLGVVLALPDPMVVILGSLRVRVPTKEAPITDIRADVFIAITPEYLLLFASMRDSKVAGFKISGDLGLYIQWSGSGAFEFSIGGFHPEFEKLTGEKPKLGEMDRLKIDLSPSKSISFVITGYFAITAGSVQLGVDGRLNADFAVIVVKAWLTLDMIFIWSPRFAFKIALELGVEVEVFGVSLCSITFRGSLEGTRPFALAGYVKVDVWFLPTFEEDLGPVTWGDAEALTAPAVDALSVAAQALNDETAWKVPLPDHAAQLVTLAEVEDVEGRIAHPLAGLEVSQTHVPLGVRISHIGSSPVIADMVTMGTPVSSAGEAAAISEMRVPFPPGHFFDLEGEELLARSGFEEMQGGCRIAAATTPKVGATAQENVSYRTYVRNPDERLVAVPLDSSVTFAHFGAAYVAASVIGRSTKASGNPYLASTEADDSIAIAAQGSSVLSDAATGVALTSGLGILNATEASAILDAATAAGIDTLTRTHVKG
ncbi:DUF6603 domain-containing protein [Mycetocola manganoxydans]|nr:DUF6603 domain-containing protein [Mycetocola manganoxydans]GHD44082.1 hypothetical protein GCM10008097_11680 [Mycetocola manganoxydans]